MLEFSKVEFKKKTWIWKSHSGPEVFLFARSLRNKMNGVRSVFSRWKPFNLDFGPVSLSLVTSRQASFHLQTATDLFLFFLRSIPKSIYLRNRVRTPDPRRKKKKKKILGGSKAENRERILLCVGFALKTCWHFTFHLTHIYMFKIKEDTK